MVVIRVCWAVVKWVKHAVGQPFVEVLTTPKIVPAPEDAFTKDAKNVGAAVPIPIEPSDNIFSLAVAFVLNDIN